MYYCTIYIRSRSEKEPYILHLSRIFNKIENSLLLGSFLLLFSQVSSPSGSPTVFFTVLVFRAIPLMLRILQWVSVKFHSSMCSVTEFRKTLNSTACEGSHIFFTGSSHANKKVRNNLIALGWIITAATSCKMTSLKNIKTELAFPPPKDGHAHFYFKKSSSKKLK